MPGLRVGHWTEPAGRTGCTVVLGPEAGWVAGVDVRGSAPGTRETDLLRPGSFVQRINAVLLTGGSAFGLDAAGGVMRYLAERGIGTRVGEACVPIVPAAVIFDLHHGDWRVHPGDAEGHLACLDAEVRETCGAGRVGAGAGATVGKVLGSAGRVPAGLGSASVRLPSGCTVGALAVVNAVGDIVGRDGRVLLGGAEDAWAHVLAHGRPAAAGGGNTTLGVIATDARLDGAGCTKLAQLGQDALALAIRPVHTLADGDTVFALSGGDREEDPFAVGVAAVEALRMAIEAAAGA